MSATNPANAETPAVPTGTQPVEVAVLAGGCFWGVEDILRDVPGVIDTAVGYTGGCRTRSTTTLTTASQGTPKRCA
jgi:peptide methionine sulfoxide reductase MsrA